MVLPLSEAWYRKLVVLALALGVGGGVIALVYSGVTNFEANLNPCGA